MISRLHRDEQGSLSIISVFALMMLVLLLGMVMNSARQIDQKVKMQNAADAATYAGGIVLARNMNTLAFTNHLLAEIFALTAFFREARDRSSESLTPEILDNWERVAPAFTGAEFPRFDRLGPAIAEKVPIEREMVLTFSVLSEAAAEMMLPVFEEILAERMIPEFQRALTETTPVSVQLAADEVARRHGQAWPVHTDLRAVLWRTHADPVGGLTEAERRTLPVVDPVLDETWQQARYVRDAREQRERLTRGYLREWNDESLHAFDVLGKMSQFSNFWRIFTCGQLTYLLEVEYPTLNLPFQIRDRVADIDNVNEHVERDFMFVGVVYRERLADRVPGVFRNPIATDTQAYSQIMLFVPTRRLVKSYPGSPENVGGGTMGGPPGNQILLPGPPSSDRPPPTAGAQPDDQVPWFVVRQSGRWYPQGWDLVNQNWTMQLVPATANAIPSILSTSPDINGVTGYRTPDLLSLTNEDLPWLSHH